MRNIITSLCCTIILSFTLQTSLLAQCTIEEKEYPTKLIEEFVQSPKWTDVRIKNGLNNASVQDIVKLNNNNTLFSCNNLSDVVKNRYDDYNVYFYKLKNKYLVVSILKQPEEVDKVVAGLSFLDIFNTSYSRIEGYSF